MTDIERLKRIMSDSGMTVTAIAEKAGIDRVTLYNRLNGVGKFTASEIVGLARALHLTKKERDQIFLTNR